MNNIVLGQYVEKNSLIHRLDPRAKLIALFLIMISIFVVPTPVKVEEKWLPFAILAGFLLIVNVIVALSKVNILSYLRSIRQVFMIVALAFAIQIFTNSTNSTSYDIPINFNVSNIIAIVILLAIYILTFKISKVHVSTFILLVILSIYILHLNIYPIYSIGQTQMKIYKDGLYNGAFFSLRIFIVITFSTAFSLTTKPTDIAKSIESLLKPLTIFKINIAVFAMMISLAIRFIPTLFNEANKILKAQASRGVDFNEGTLKDKVSQIISLIIPMFVISYKKADDLALAMEARGYVPENKRTSIVKLKFAFIDFIIVITTILLLASTIVWRIIL